MGGWRSCWPVYVGQCLGHCVPSVFWSYDSASVSLTILCQCLGIAHGSEMFWNCARNPLLEEHCAFSEVIILFQ